MKTGYQSPKTWQTNKTVHAALFALHPELFSLESPKPFKIGLFLDIKELYPDLPKGRIAAVLAWLTIRRAYLAACTEGAPRWGFNGPDGEVTAKQAAFAVEMLKVRGPAPERVAA